MNRVAEADDDPDDPAGIALITGWIGTVLSGPASDPVARAEAVEAAADLASELAAMAPDARQEAVRAEWPVHGLVQVLDQLPAESVADVAADMVAAVPEDRAYIHRLCEAALRQAAAQAKDAAAILRPGSAASALTVAYHTSGVGAAYGHALAEAARRAPNDSAVLRRFIAALGTTVAPSEISRLVAVLHDAADARFGGAAAHALARGHLFARLLAPALDAAAGPPGEALRRLANEGSSAASLQPLLEAMDEYVRHVVAAGRQANAIAADREDSDDLVTLRGAALASEFDLFATFAEPTPPDPLGTRPAIAVTALGQAILQARQRRPADFNWAAVQQLQDEDPDGFAILLRDERCEVLDLCVAVEPMPAGE